MSDARIHVTEHTDITDHLHLEVESMDEETFAAFADEIRATAERYGEVVERE